MWYNMGSKPFTTEENMFEKITEGTVVQRFDNTGKCIRQDFHAGDIVEYSTPMGDPLDPTELPLSGGEYQPFDMVQPD